MSHIPTFISDLSLILVSAGIMTLIFKKLKQPLILGYLVAGFLAGPHFSFLPSVVELDNIHVWAEIGVIFLLFALGLEFSIKKLVKIGGTAVIAASTIIFCMLLLGISAGVAFGWNRMDCIFLGGMIAMSSTTIIYKAFDDLGVRKQAFASLVLSILIIEDILAIVLMVFLSTLAVSKEFEGLEMVQSIAKLAFFLILWFVVGIYFIPLFLKKVKSLMSNETLLIVSLGLCFVMVVFADYVGFSPALGAFIMGSILSETVEAETIEHIVTPVKDLFGAIFFVSVGMMVDLNMISEYALPIIVVTLVVMLGQSFFGTFGVLLSGKPLKTAIQCGFSLTQIGEFAFIIASLGVSLKVTSDFLYPIVVAVSVITTFLTPYMMKLSPHVIKYAEEKMPLSWKRFLDRYSSGGQTVNSENLWKKFLTSLIRSILVYSILCFAVILLSVKFFYPFILSYIPQNWANLIAIVVTILLISPFLRAIVTKKSHSIEFIKLWKDNHINRGPLVSIILVRFVIAVLFIMFIIAKFYKVSVGLAIGIGMIVVILTILSRWLKSSTIYLEKRFFQNLRYREEHNSCNCKKVPNFAGQLISRDIHLADFDVNYNVQLIGKSLRDLKLGSIFGIHVVAILRGTNRINIPSGSNVIYPLDKLQVIGTDDQLAKFGEYIDQQEALDAANQGEVCEDMKLKQVVVSYQSPLNGCSLSKCGIRETYKCLVVGVEREGKGLVMPTMDTTFQEEDTLWLVGEESNLRQLINE